MFRVDGNSKVCVFEVYLAHKVLRTKNVCNHLHLEMMMAHKILVRIGLSLGVALPLSFPQGKGCCKRVSCGEGHSLWLSCLKGW